MSTQWPLLFVCQVCWRWCRRCCSWGTWPSRRSVTLTRPPCLTTLVHTFTQAHHHHYHHHHFLCACCLSRSICSNLPDSSNIHLLRPPIWSPCFTPSCPESVSPAKHQCDRLHTSHPVSQNQGLHRSQYIKVPWHVYLILLMIMAT